MMYDITLGDSEGNYKISEKTPVGEKNSAGTYNMYEYKIQINKLSDVAKIAVLAEPMGGSRDNIGNYEKYTKADIEDMSIRREDGQALRPLKIKIKNQQEKKH